MSKAGRKRHIPRVMELYQKYGDDLADSLELWKKYHDVPSQYSRMKFIRKEYNNLINNALNFPIQSFASSIVNQSAIAISKWLKANNIPAYICLQVHDQLVLRCRTEDAATIKPQMKWFMENTIILKAPLTADPEVADNLREGH
jgi:DNA polymerase I-like protein with 3'-5' exonuclease and polymerase domains